MRGRPVNCLELAALSKALTPQLYNDVRKHADILTFLGPGVSPILATAFLVHR